MCVYMTNERGQGSRAHALRTLCVFHTRAQKCDEFTVKTIFVFLFRSVCVCIAAGFLPRRLTRVCPVDEHGPAEHVLDVARAAGEAVLQLLHQLLLAQAVDDGRHALRQAEEGEDDHGAALLGLAAHHVALVQHRQHEADEVGQQEDGQLAEVQRDGPAAGAVAAVEHAEAAALQQDPDVAVREGVRRRAELSFTPSSLF